MYTPEDQLNELSQQQLCLTAACLSHFAPCERGLHFLSAPLPPIPPRMFIAQKIISLVISAPLWAAINFSSLHDGPACGHRSLTFSKRSINLSVHPATYPLMFSSSPVVFFFLLSGCWLLGGKVALSLCALQDLVGVCLCNYTSAQELDQNQPVEKMMVIWTEENMHLRQREGKPILSMVTTVNSRRGWGRAKAKWHITLPARGQPISPNLLPVFLC